MLTQVISPAIKAHMDVHVSLVTDMFKKLFDSIQKISQLNVHFAQELMADMTSANHQMLAAKDSTELASVLAAQTPPATEKFRNYQQQLSNLVASVNVELTKAAESHMPEASRTATMLADELVRTASEEAEKAAQRQRAVLDKMNESARWGIDRMSQNNASSQSQSSAPQTH